jgi:rubrerythrin
MKRQFTSLSPQEALHVAIFIEERNSELYHRFAEMFVEFRDVESLEIASVFWDMAAEERSHSTMLQQRYGDLYGTRACSITEEDLQEMIEIPRLEESEVFSNNKDNVAPARERALQVALNAERQARVFYASLAESTSDRALKRVYTDLAEFELDHVEFLEKRLEQKSSKE